MLHAMRKIGLLAALLLLTGAAAISAQDVVREGDDDPYYYADRGRIDRYLSAEVWTDHSDAEYYEGDNITIYFRVNTDAFVAIYSIDSRGMVNLLFPSRPDQDNYVRGGVTYALPGADDDFDLVLSGPQGTENIQIVASREQFPIPGWYNNSGLVCDRDDRDEYMDYLNGRYFVRYDGQRFAYDRAVVFVDQWEQDYFRPVYYPYYPSWSVCGNVYIDYPWGSSVYINGYYWGCTPLYIPRILVGWNTLTIFDPWGYCWESDFHVSRYHTVIFDKTIIRTSPGFRSKFKEVREVGYRDPVKAGYPDFYQRVASKKAIRTVSGSAFDKSGVTSSRSKSLRDLVTRDEYESFAAPAKKYVRGSSELVKNDRGYETRTIVSDKTVKSNSRGSSGDAATRSIGTASKTRRSTTPAPSGVNQSTQRSGSAGKTTNSDGYYQKKSVTVDKQSGSSPRIERQSTQKKNTSTYNQPSKTKSSGKSRTSSTPSYQAPKKSDSKGSSATVTSRPSTSGGRSSNQGNSSGGKSSSSSSSSGKKRSR